MFRDLFRNCRAIVATMQRNFVEFYKMRQTYMKDFIKLIADVLRFFQNSKDFEKSYLKNHNIRKF